MTPIGYVPVLNREDLRNGSFAWVASHHRFPGVLAQADTPEEAEAIWHENLADRLKDMAEDGIEAPPVNHFRIIQSSTGRVTPQQTEIKTAVPG